MFTGNYTIAQNSDISSITITDTSDYTSEPKNTFNGRKIYLYLSGSGTLVPEGTTTSYIDFPFSGGDSITLNVLDRDYAINVKVVWEPISPQPNSVYEKEGLVAFTSNSENFYYELTSNEASNPNIIRDSGYWDNKSQLRTYIDSAQQAVTNANDIVSAQAALDQAYYLMVNQSKFF